MHRPAKSKHGRIFGYQPPSQVHPLICAARRAKKPTKASLAALPDVFDLEPKLTPVRDQLHLGDCFAFSTSAADELDHGLTTAEQWLSPKYLARIVRHAEGTFGTDRGASVADGMAAAHGRGICPEKFLPYVDEVDKDDSGNAQCDVAAAPYRISQPAYVDPFDFDAICAVLATSRVIPFGFFCYESFEEQGADGEVPPVSPNDGLMGGHSLAWCGYDRVKRKLKARGSWGAGFGKGGYSFFPASYLEHMIEAWVRS